MERDYKHYYFIIRGEKVKVYTYTKLSTAMQTDGYSLDVQKIRMKVYADYNDYEIASTYEDAGKQMIHVLSVVAEIERDNIRVQTRGMYIEKAREGK